MFSLDRSDCGILLLSLQPGFYDTTSGCRPCECNQGGSVSQICDQTSNNAQCPCIPFVELTTCRMPVDGNFSKALDDIIFEAEEGTLTGVYVICDCHHILFTLKNCIGCISGNSN